MIISIRSSGSIDFGNYLTNRKKDAYFVIEGDSKRIDGLAADYLAESAKRKNSHTSFVLSFKEENLTKDEMIKYYMQFKEMMFKNYLDEELEILSVIHFDDKKPHIHCTVLNGSMVDNFHELRLFRGNIDIPRSTAIQEIINYKNNIESPFENFNLLSLTQEQKERDWLVKHGKNSYRVFDDDFFDFIEKIIPATKDYDDFLNKIKNQYGKVLIKRSKDILKNEGINAAVLLKENQLVLTMYKKSDKVSNYVYSSKMFDKRWFNRHLEQIKNRLNSGKKLKDIKFSEKRKSLQEYEKIFDETTIKHEKHLTDRKVGKNYLRNNFDYVLENGLQKIKKEFLDNREIFETKDSAETFGIKVERYLSFCDDKRYIASFVDNLGGVENFDILEDDIAVRLYSKENRDKFIDIYDKKLLGYLKSVSGDDDSEDGAYRYKKDLEYYEFMELLKKIKNNKYKNKIRAFLEKDIFDKRVLTQDDLIELLRFYGLKVVNVGDDVKKGNYITLESNIGKIALYNPRIVSIYKDEFYRREDYIQKRDKQIEDYFSKEFIANLVNDVYLKNIDKYKIIYKRVESVKHYRILNSDNLDDSIFNCELKNGEKLSIDNYPHFTDNEIIKKHGDSGVEIEHSHDKFLTGYRMAELFARKKYDKIYLSSGMSEDMQKGTIERIKEMGYPIDIYLEGDGKEKLLYSGKQDISILKKEATEEFTKELEKDVKKVIDNIKKIAKDEDIGEFNHEEWDRLVEYYKQDVNQVERLK